MCTVGHSNQKSSIEIDEEVDTREELELSINVMIGNFNSNTIKIKEHIKKKKILILIDTGSNFSCDNNRIVPI